MRQDFQVQSQTHGKYVRAQTTGKGSISVGAGSLGSPPETSASKQEAKEAFESDSK